MHQIDMDDSRKQPVVLMPSCDRYAGIARWSLRRLDRFWPSHPQVWICGITIPMPVPTIPLTVSPEDWVGIAMDAVDTLRAKGHGWAYIILDDHPPFGPCHEAYLGRWLPQVACDLSAACVNLAPWDGISTAFGRLHTGEPLHLRAVSASDRWRYSLHPALWNLNVLSDVLKHVRSAAGVASARHFEAVSGRPESMPQHDHDCYRVAGRPYAVSPGPLDGQFRRWVHHGRRWWYRWMKDPRALDTFDQNHEHITRYLSGPYPMFWSGIMHGGLHDAAIMYLNMVGENEAVSELNEIVREMKKKGEG